MLYPMSPKVVELKRKLESFMDRHIYPNEERFYREAEELGPWEVYPVVEELKPQARAEGLWNLFLPESSTAPGLTNLEYAPLCEVMGRSHLAPGGVQLLGARHRQHGGAGALRHAGAAGALAGAAARRRDPLLLRDDRAGGRLERRDQHRELDRARRRRLRHQRPQVVHHQRDRPALQDLHLHGQDRPGQRRPPPAAVDDPGADGHARRRGRSGRCRCSASTACPTALPR